MVTGCTLYSMSVLPVNMYNSCMSVERDRETIQTLDFSHRREHRKSQRHMDVCMQTACGGMDCITAFLVFLRQGLIWTRLAWNSVCS